MRLRRLMELGVNAPVRRVELAALGLHAPTFVIGESAGDALPEMPHSLSCRQSLSGTFAAIVAVSARVFQPDEEEVDIACATCGNP